MAADTSLQRKARGAFFTPSELVRFITRWAIRDKTDRVLEPSCGDAAFLVEAARGLLELGADVSDMPDLLHAAEIHEESARKAESAVRQAGGDAEVFVGDFFEAPFMASSYKAVVGNPPYVRYQEFSGPARLKAREAAMAAGVRLTALASSWAAFVVQSGELLAPDGRMGLVLPAELLTVNYAAPVRSYLMERFSSVRLVLFEELVFPGVLEEVVLLLAEGSGPTDHLEVCQITSEKDLSSPDAVRWIPPLSSAKWTPALMPTTSADLYTDFLLDDGFELLEEWGDIDLGMVTGNNRYFTLNAATADSCGLTEGSLLRISPPGSRHLRGLTFTTKTWEEMVLSGSRGYLFYPKSTDLLPEEQAYVDAGLEQAVDNAYKCRVRTPWWRVPLTDPAHLLFTYMNHHTPRMVANRANVRHLNSVHGVRLHAGRVRTGQDLLPIGSLNSVTLLGAELVGRSYGGGILKLEPKEADLLPVPSQTLLDNASDDLRRLRPQLGTLLRGGDLHEAVRLVDRVLLLEHSDLSTSDLAELRAARNHLFERRAARNGNGQS